MTHPALFWERLEGGATECRLCPRRCRIAPGRAGFCRARRNEGGALVAATYGEATAVALDPVEKKPLYHFHPGATILSLGANGCNLACSFCQNWHLSREDAPTRTLTPAEVAALARRPGCCGVAYTYNEPTVGLEFVLDCAAEVKRAGLANVLVTNGWLEPEPFEALLSLVDALNIDVKGFTEAFYRDVCGGTLAPVLRNLRRAADAGLHVEATNLLVPGLNDGDGEIAALADFIASVSPDLPLHLTAYHPDHRCDRPATPAATLARAHAIAKRKLRHVYVGNVRDPERGATYCPGCGARAVERSGYATRSRLAPGGRCPECGADLGIRT